jgi:hypothetical protein
MAKKRPPTKPASKPKAPAIVQAAVHPIRTEHLVLILRISGFITLVGVLLAWAFPQARVWGFHHLAFLPWPLSATLIVIAALSWTPLGGKFADRILPHVTKFLRRTWLVMAAAVVLFVGLQVSVPLLGDGTLWIKELSWIGEFKARGQSVPAGRWLKRKEPLEIASHELVFRAVAALHPPAALSGSAEDMEVAIKVREQWFRDAARRVYFWMSIAAGAAAVWLALRFARRRLLETQRPLFLRIVLGSSASLLFFGYVENYSWMFVWMLACLLAGLEESFPPRRFPVKTLLLFLVAVAFHLAMVFLLPALLFLLWIWLRPNRGVTLESQHREFVARRAWIIMAVFAVLGLAGYLYVKGWKGWISVMPLTAALSRDGYAFLTLSHFLDLLNLAALVLLPATIILIASRLGKDRPACEYIQTAFLALTAGCGAAFVAVFNPNLGMARDWDLLAACLLPVLVLAGWKLAHADLGMQRGAILAALAGFGVLITVPYILVQAGEKWSVARYETLLKLDRARSAYGWENLAVYFESKNDLENRIRAWSMAAEVSGNVRYRVNQAVALRLADRLEEAEPITVAAARKDPKYAFQLVYLAQSYGGRGSIAKARELAHLAADLAPNDKGIAEFCRTIEQNAPQKSP